MKLICVDPARVREFWPHVRRMVFASTKRLALFERVETSVLSGDQLLWFIWDGTQIRATATTHLSNGECTVTTCSGSGLLDWANAFREIQEYAKNEGCTVRVQGRSGWKRAFERLGIDVGSVVFEERAA